MKNISHYIILVVFAYAAHGQKTDSLLVVLNDKQGSDRIEVLHELVINLWLTFPENAMGYGEEALMLSEKAGDSFAVSKSLRLIAGVHYYKADYDLSLDYNIRALNIAKTLNDSSLIGNGYNNIGLLYYNLGNYPTSLEYLLRSKQIKERINETYGLATVLNNIGLIFNETRNFEKAKVVFTEAYDVALKIKDGNNLVYSLNNKGIAYLNEGADDTALSHFRRAWSLSKLYENVNWGSVSLRRIGEVFVKKGLLDSARYYCELSMEASEKIADKKGIVEVYQILTKYALAKEKTEEALFYLNQSHELATQLKLRQHLLNNLKLYIVIYQSSNEPTMVMDYQGRYIQLRDSLFLDVVNRNLSLVPIKLKEESDRITLSSQQNELKSKSFSNKIYAFALIVIIPLVIFLIVLLRKNQKANRNLIQFNEELQKTQKLLVTSEKMASLGMMATGIAHEINNPLNFIKNGVEALSKKVGESKIKDKEELNALFKIVNEGVVRSTKIVKSLSHFSRKSPEMNEACNIKEIIENCLLILHSKVKDRVRVKTRFARGKNLVRGNEGRLHQVMMNIISNAEQAIEGTGTIEISTTVIDGNLEVVIQDDGSGISEENLSKIGEPFFTTKAAGVGTGLGLFITFSIIDEHNGEIDVTSSPEMGTKFIISLPLV